MSNRWYEIVDAGVSLTQGDIVPNCPVLTWKPDTISLNRVESAELARAHELVLAMDIVVMTQACDLEQNKVRNVVVCPCISISEFRKNWDAQRSGIGQVPGKAWRSFCKNITKGVVWTYAMLNESDLETYPSENRIVDFSEVITVPRIFLESLIKQRGKERLRLLPPYREHLSQAFARFFMRVGLPVSVKENW